MILTAGTLSIDAQGVLTLNGYVFDDQLTWSFDPVSSRAIDAIEHQVNLLNKKLSELSGNLGVKGNVPAVIEIARVA